jgi:hypothetical protein
MALSTALDPHGCEQREAKYSIGPIFWYLGDFRLTKFKFTTGACSIVNLMLALPGPMQGGFPFSPPVEIRPSQPCDVHIF